MTFRLLTMALLMLVGCNKPMDETTRLVLDTSTANCLWGKQNCKAGIEYNDSEPNRLAVYLNDETSYYEISSGRIYNAAMSLGCSAGYGCFIGTTVHCGHQARLWLQNGLDSRHLTLGDAEEFRVCPQG
ncbi:hypothetical protein HN358_04670 [Candidatus Uhrbacteria bacterium]|nr:hypothetical protein [Candidatus Uhrbacteria bacterium]MBT7717076.1 hypothetical protein [Candidatus Uhrbacteria bacterium]